MNIKEISLLLDEGKICSSCGEIKLYKEFCKAKRSKDGHEYLCKKCKSEYNRKYYENPEKKEHIRSRKKRLEKNSKAVCCEPDCNNGTYYTRIYCKLHYQKKWAAGEIIDRPDCSYDGCDRKVYGKKSICFAHYMRLKTGNTDKSPIKKRVKQGSGTINKSGYKIIRKDNKPVFEHRVIMEEYLGRSLLECERVHHINGNRLDNRISNLELWTTSHPYGQRVQDKLKWAHEIIDFYEMGIDNKAILTFEAEVDDVEPHSPKVEVKKEDLVEA